MQSTPTPRFDALAARRLRATLGMAPGDVSHGLWAQYGLRVPADTVVSWERGLSVPGSHELTALAGVLWCSPSELLAAPATLREHRTAVGLAPEDLARRVGLDTVSYRRMEESGRWRGNERQTAALADELGLTPRELVTATGRDDELAGLLRSAVTTRWQAYVKPAAKLLPLPRAHIEDVLEQPHADYQARMVATLSWSGSPGSREAGQAGQECLDAIVGHFWERVRD